MIRIVISLISFYCLPLLASSAIVDCVTVQGRGAENRKCEIWYRVPKDYDANSKSLCRVFVFFGGRNYSGKSQTGYANWNGWFDKNNIFLISPSFRNEDYWEPQGWSGRALLEGIEKIKKKYPNICDSKMLFYGYSAGAQCSNLFPAWIPEKSRAYVSHACGVFHKPSERMKKVFGLITCGDADRQRLIINHRFIEDYRKLGVNILWKSFPNHPHDVPQGSTYLAQAFLEYYNKLYACDLDSTIPYPTESKSAVFVGDDIDAVVYPINSPLAKQIYKEDRAYFFSKELADAWVKSATMP